MSILHQLFLGALRQTQHLPPGQLAQYQLELIENIARHARDNVPFYRDRLAPAFRGDKFLPDRWRDIPVLARGDVLGNAQEMWAQQVPPDAGRHSEYHTSGSTGVPLRFRASEASTVASNCQNERMWEAFGIDRTAHYATIRIDGQRQSPYPLGRGTTGWNKTFPQSRHSLLEIATPVREQAEWLTLQCDRARPTA
jgi:phenylacetate-CoA ligase